MFGQATSPFASPAGTSTPFGGVDRPPTQRLVHRLPLGRRHRHHRRALGVGLLLVDSALHRRRHRQPVALAPAEEALGLLLLHPDPPAALVHLVRLAAPPPQRPSGSSRRRHRLRLGRRPRPPRGVDCLVAGPTRRPPLGHRLNPLDLEAPVPRRPAVVVGSVLLRPVQRHLGLSPHRHRLAADCLVVVEEEERSALPLLRRLRPLDRPIRALERPVRRLRRRPPDCLGAPPRLPRLRRRALAALGRQVHHRLPICLARLLGRLSPASQVLPLSPFRSRPRRMVPP